MKLPEPRRRGAFWCIRVRMTAKERAWVRVAKATAPPLHARNQARVWMDNREANIAEWLADREAERSAPPPVVGDDKAMTVRKLAVAWTSGLLLKEHGKVSRLRADRKLDSARQCLARCCDVKTRGERGPVFGDLPVAVVTESDVKTVLRLAPKAASKARTTLGYYSALHRLFDLAERPCHLRPRHSSPVDVSLRPALDDDKLFSFLLPREVEAILRYEGPIQGTKGHYLLTERDLLRWKVLLVLGCYIGLRKANLVDIRWRNVDLDTGSFFVLRTKTGVPVHATLHFACVVEILKRWKAYTNPKPDDRIVTISDRQRRRAKHVLHTILRAAGVTREILFLEDNNVEPLRFHDLRSTFVTWAKRAGLSDDFIKARTGHMTQAMIERYARLATTVEAATFVPFPDLSDAIPELPRVGTRVGTSVLDGRGWSDETASGSARHAGAVPRLQNGLPRSEEWRKRRGNSGFVGLGGPGSPLQKPARNALVGTDVATRIAELRTLARCGSLPELDALEAIEAVEVGS